jgi:hypothetical protein
MKLMMMKIEEYGGIKIGSGKPECLEKMLPQYNFVHNSHMDCPRIIFKPTRREAGVEPLKLWYG